MAARTKCFFEMTADGSPLGKIVMELCDDIVPLTCSKSNIKLVQILLITENNN